MSGLGGIKNIFGKIEQAEGSVYVAKVLADKVASARTAANNEWPFESVPVTIVETSELEALRDQITSLTEQRDRWHGQATLRAGIENERDEILMALAWVAGSLPFDVPRTPEHLRAPDFVVKSVKKARSLAALSRPPQPEEET